MWDAASRQPVGPTFEASAGQVFSLAFSADGSRIASGSEEGFVRLWDARTGREIGEAIHQEGPIQALAFSADGTRLASAGRSSVRLRDGVDGTAVAPEVLADGDIDWVRGVAFDPKGKRIITTGDRGIIRIWDTATGRQVHAPLQARNIVFRLAFSPDGSRFASGDLDGVLRIWDAKDYLAIGNPIRGLAFSATGHQILTGGEDGAVRLWDVASGEGLGSLLAELRSPVAAVGFDASDARMFSGALSGAIRVAVGPSAWTSALCAKLTRNMSEAQWRDWVSPEVPYQKQCPSFPELVGR